MQQRFAAVDLIHRCKQNFTMEAVKIQPALNGIFVEQYHYQLHINTIW